MLEASSTSMPVKGYVAQGEGRQYAGQQFVGIDLQRQAERDRAHHRRRGMWLEAVQILLVAAGAVGGDPLGLGEHPSAVVESTYGWYWLV